MLFKSKVTTELVEELLKQRISLTHIYYLGLLADNISVNPPLEVLQLLERRLMISEGRITPIGIEFYENILRGKKLKKTGLKTSSEEFDKFWTIFPSTDNFTYNNRRFEGVRSLKNKKDDCRATFNKYIATGEYTAEQIIAGTTAYIELVKKQSYQKGENKLTFIFASERFLREKVFAEYINIVQIEEKKKHLVNPEDLF